MSPHPRSRHIAVVAALAVGVVAGCDEILPCNPLTDPDCIPTDSEADSDTETPGEFQTYHYVLILDRESTDTGGMELDAVELIKGSSLFADDFHECIQGPGIEHVTTTTDCNQALGPPNNAAGECDSDDTFFVNLGGLGGSLVVSFFDLTEIVTGDVVRVYECGSVADVYDVLIGTGTSVTDTHWVPCALNASGVSECTVPMLPDIPQN